MRIAPRSRRCERESARARVCVCEHNAVGLRTVTVPTGYGAVCTATGTVPWALQ